MAINIKRLIANTLLELVEEKPLEKIKIKDIIDRSEISRQTYYHHFLDKQDLIQYIYLNYVINDWEVISEGFDFYQGLQNAYHNYEKYHRFMKQALLLEGQNNLHDFMIAHCIELDNEYYKRVLKVDCLPEDFALIAKYNSIASMEIACSWILSDMPSPPETMVDCTVNVRYASVSPILARHDKEDIYVVAKLRSEENKSNRGE